MKRRPGHYVKRTGDMICERIALGDTLAEALVSVGYLAPSERQFWKWIDTSEQFRDQYERARQLQADKLADVMLEHAKSVLKVDGKQANKYKVSADILKWQAEVRNRGKYGAKSEAKSPPPLNADEIKAEIARLEKALGIGKPEGEPKLHAVK